MFINVRKLLMGFVLSVMLLPLISIASTEFKGTETVNINKANAATLAAYLKGVGVNKAEAIVKYRKTNGSFKSAADIKNVPGIGDETFKDIKSKISTSRGKSTAPKGYKLGESSGKSSSTKKKPTTKKSSTKKSTNTDKTTSSKSKSSKAKKTTKAKKTATTKKESTNKKSIKETSTKKKPSTTKKKTSKKKTTKKKPAKKKTTKKKTTKKKTAKKKSS